MTSGIFGRRSPVQKKLGRLHWIILRDASNREKSAKELADNYGVSLPSLSVYYKKNNIKKKRKHRYITYIKAKSGHKSKVKNLKDYIRENNITKRQVKLAVLSICQDIREEKGIIRKLQVK